MRASSYLPLPKELQTRKGCLNIQNNDKKRFLWSMLASLHPVQRKNSPYRVSKYQEHEHELNMPGIHNTISHLEFMSYIKLQSR